MWCSREKFRFRIDCAHALEYNNSFWTCVLVVSFAAVIRVVALRSSPLTAAHSSSAFLSLCYWEPKTCMYLLAGRQSYFSSHLPPKTRFPEYGSLLLIGQFEERNAELEWAAISGEDRCVTTLITATKETSGLAHLPIWQFHLEGLNLGANWKDRPRKTSSWNSVLEKELLDILTKIVQCTNANAAIPLAEPSCTLLTIGVCVCVCAAIPLNSSFFSLWCVGGTLHKNLREKRDAYLA